MAQKGRAARRWRKKRIANGYYAGGIGTLVSRLKQLGFSKYSEYLVSDHWLQLRTKVLSVRGYSCEICACSEGKIALHHRTYERFGTESDDDLILVCSKCHDRIHASERMGGKGGLEGALKRVRCRVMKQQEPMSKIQR
jgi:hypothetical protein